ncbi:hypothetical protein COZ14_03310, partial [Candidatus Dojkabacteria bacterium CG_4_10_14_3_um_filter_Dojkabacteria_WS6_41_9]
PKIFCRVKECCDSDRHALIIIKLLLPKHQEYLSAEASDINTLQTYILTADVRQMFLLHEVFHALILREKWLIVNWPTPCAENNAKLSN